MNRFKGLWLILLALMAGHLWGGAVVVCEGGMADVDQLVQTIEGESRLMATFKASVIAQRAGLPDTE